MASATTEKHAYELELLKQINSSLQSLQRDYMQLAASVEAIEGRVNILSGVKQVQDVAREPAPLLKQYTALARQEKASDPTAFDSESSFRSASVEENHTSALSLKNSPSGRSSTTPTSKIILTTYPGQSGIDPLPMQWGHKDPMQRGPVVVSRAQSTVRRRNGQ